VASNRSALDEAPYGSSGVGIGTLTGTDPYPTGAERSPAIGETGAYPGPGGYAEPSAFAEPGTQPAHDERPWEEWNPTEESLASIRGKHRVAKQRGGTMARSGAVLGVGVIAAVGAGGMATAKDRPTAPISVPDLAHLTSDIHAALPQAKELPGIGTLLDGGSPTTGAPFTQAGLTAQDTANGVTDAGEALRARILQQAESQQNAADEAEREAASKAAAARAAEQAAKQKAAEEEKKKAAERKAKEEAEKKAEAARLAKLATEYTLPVSSYTLTAGFGEAGDLWSANHTGQDFAAPTGTPVKAVHGGTITQAGWAGAYGYRIVLTLDDGTQLWFCHLSSMVKTSGKVTTGEVIGRVGATGNVTGPHLHLEVRPGGGDPIDPMPWLRAHGLHP
jgi:murein DD-endopeptidase MepM/ murein hydrolase activator NlpD